VLINLGSLRIFMALYANDFSKVFSTLLEEKGISCYQISRYTNLDQAYLSRLKNGGKHDPSPETLIKISLALAHYGNQVKLDDIQRLFKSVGRSIITREV
jgi:transcriptional regulator with XRE-family HTH domain